MRYRYSYEELTKRADNFHKMVIERCRKLSIKAGLDPQLLGIHPHNAQVAYDNGHPWPEVDYKLCRKINWLLNEYQWKAHRLVDELIQKGRI